MKIDVVTNGEALPCLKDLTVIVIDVLRCTTSMVTAVSNGAKAVAAFKDIESAREFARRKGRENCILGGERKAVKIDGFDVGNSPLEYSKANVEGKFVVMSTTNGTSAIEKAEAADTLILGAMINAGAAAKKAAEIGKDVLILCSGTEGKQSADDLMTAGAIIDKLKAMKDITLTDMAIICEHLYKSWKQGEFDITKTFHCNRLLRMGFAGDVKYCFTEDVTDCTPQFAEGIIK